MLVDPRPYTYEFRKPRYSNPTLYFQPYQVNLAISTKVYTIATPTNQMITSHNLPPDYHNPPKNHKKTYINKNNVNSNEIYPK